MGLRVGGGASLLVCASYFAELVRSQCIRLHSNRTSLSARVDFLDACSSKFMDFDFDDARELAYKKYASAAS